MALYVSSMAIEWYIQRVLWLVKHLYGIYYRKWCLLLSTYWWRHFNQRLFTSLLIVVNKSRIVHVLRETVANSIWSMTLSALQPSSDLVLSPSIAAPPGGRHLELLASFSGDLPPSERAFEVSSGVRQRMDREEIGNLLDAAACHRSPLDRVNIIYV